MTIQTLQDEVLNYGILNLRGFIIPKNTDNNDAVLKQFILQYEHYTQCYYDLYIGLKNKKTKKYQEYVNKFNKCFNYMTELKKLAFIRGVKYDSLYQ